MGFGHGIKFSYHLIRKFLTREFFSANFRGYYIMLSRLPSLRDFLSLNIHKENLIYKCLFKKITIKEKTEIKPVIYMGKIQVSKG